MGTWWDEPINSQRDTDPDESLPKTTQYRVFAPNSDSQIAKYWTVQGKQLKLKADYKAEVQQCDYKSGRGLNFTRM